MVEELLVNKFNFRTVKPNWNIFHLKQSKVIVTEIICGNAKMIITETMKVKWFTVYIHVKKWFTDGFVFFVLKFLKKTN